ncbi:Aldo/keto reductase [Coprinellus micaceus]|uniref:Aldo/keto reductase n=1 Tax=Coprinellus micaceus TaxID=71717 RepID=A0A4Y7TCS2_COPMI|nr:Aldo/keto reductase [Coprinellus micaceus]
MYLHRPWFPSQDGESELFIGEWMQSRGIRDQIFLATKYTNSPAIRDPNVAQKIQFSGNSLKSMHLGIEGSLKRLNTSYIDLFYLMQALHGLVLSRKVLYLGISDAPAWVVTKANQYARDHALTQFSVYQGMWSILERSFERDIIPMARDEGIALAPWAVLAGGKIRSDAEEERRRQSGEKGRAYYNGTHWERTEDQINDCKALEKVAVEVGAKSIGAVAIAYVLHKTTFVFPIIGGRGVENLLENIEALDIALTDKHLKFLDSVAPLDLGFPHNFIGDGLSTAMFNNANGHPAYWPAAKPISPAH